MARDVEEMDKDDNSKYYYYYCVVLFGRTSKLVLNFLMRRPWLFQTWHLSLYYVYMLQN
jgi:hypothetical protein